MGMESCLRQARECVYWPGMSADVKQEIKHAKHAGIWIQCSRETLLPLEIPTRPWQRVGADLFEFEGRDYIVTDNYYNIFW